MEKDSSFEEVDLIERDISSRLNEAIDWMARHREIVVDELRKANTVLVNHAEQHHDAMYEQYMHRRNIGDQRLLESRIRGGLDSLKELKSRRHVRPFSEWVDESVVQAIKTKGFAEAFKDQLILRAAFKSQ